MALPSRYVKGFHQEFVVNTRLVGHPQVTAANTGTPRIEAIFESVVIVTQLIFLFRLPAHIARPIRHRSTLSKWTSTRSSRKRRPTRSLVKRGRANSTCCVS